MPEPIPFKHANADLAAPQGMTNCDSLPIARTDDGRMISCWRFTKPELEQLYHTGVLWVHVFGDRHPPIAFTTQDPFAPIKG